MEVVGRVEHVCGLVAEPLDVGDDGVDVLGLLCVRVGVVQAQVAEAAEVLRDAEVLDDGFGVADVEIAVRFWGEAGLDAAAVGALLVVAPNDLADEVVGCAGCGCLGHGRQIINPRTDSRARPRR